MRILAVLACAGLSFIAGYAQTSKNGKGFDSYEIKPHTRQFSEALAPLLGAPYDDRLYSPK